MKDKWQAMHVASTPLPVTRIDSVPPAPVILLRGGEDFFADEAISVLLGRAREADPQVEVTRVDAASYESRSLDTWLSPSLFGESRVIIVRGVETTNDAFLADSVRLLPTLIAEGPGEVQVIVHHRKGVRGKKLLDTLTKADVPQISCEALKNDREKSEYLTGLVRGQKRRIASDALQALIDAVGSDLRELVGATRQLLADTTGVVDVNTVRTYYAGRIEASGFEVADAAIAGDGPRAVTLLRHAVATGTDVVPIVAAIAMKLRTMAKVAAAGTGANARDLGLAPWQIKRAQQDLKGWRPDGLAAAMLAVARADLEVKGASRDGLFALERAVLAVAGAQQK